MPIPDNRYLESRHTGARLLAGLICLAVVAGGLAAGVAADVPPAQRLAGLTGADALHAEGLTGRGVTIAVVGRFAAPPPEVLVAEDGRTRLLARFDAATGDRQRASGQGAGGDSTGHEALRAMLSNRRDARARFEGVAPDADLVLARVPGDDGGRRSDPVRAVEWVIANRDRLGIRVLHLALAAPPRPDLEDPVALAVVEAWRAGIVVVAAAGDGGPAPASVAAPADVPQVITVGAAIYGPGGPTVAAWSAGGPTPDGFVKPEILGPAGSAGAGQAAAAGTVAQPSGTAVSSAVVAGAVALLLEASPWLTPDEVKLRLLATARPLVGPDGGLVGPHRQGAGMVDARAAAVLPVRFDGADGLALGITWSESSGRRLFWSEGAGQTRSDLTGTGASGSTDQLAGYTWSE